MNRNYRLIGLATLGLGLAGFGWFQQNAIEFQGKTIVLHERTIAQLRDELRDELRKNGLLRMENEGLLAENRMLRDSLFWLENRVKELSDKLAWHEATLKGIRIELEKKVRELLASQKELAELKRQQAPVAAIQQKEKEVEITQKQASELKKMETHETTIKAETGKFLDEQNMKANRLQAAVNLARTTIVRFNNLELRHSKSENPIKELDADGRNWLFSDMKLEFESPDMSLLSERFFIVKFIDIDTRKPLPREEVNPAFPDSEYNSAGFEVKWTGNPVTGYYPSRGQKTGKNYDLQVYLIHEGQEIRMPKANKAVIRNGVVLD